MQLRNDVIIASIIRENKLIVPRGDDCIKMNDNVIVITSSKGLHDINEIFN
jgi:trk system potassium uptake protein TrkA